MSDTPGEEREFTREELLAALKRIGAEVRQEAFAAGCSIMITKNSHLVLQHPDGSEEVVGSLHSAEQSARDGE